MSNHIVRTAHIQHLIENGLYLAQRCDGAGQQMHCNEPVPGNPSAAFARQAQTIDALEKAAADLRHAAEELIAERLSLMGWPQV